MSTLLALPLAEILFTLAGLTALAAAMVAVTRRNPVYSLLALMVMFGALALLFVLMQASFLAAMELFLYAGAIMILFVFVLMLLRLTAADLKPEGEPGRQLRWGFLALLVLAPLAVGILAATVGAEISAAPSGFGSTVGVALEHFTMPETAGLRGAGEATWNPYILPFEIISVLLITAIVGAVVLVWRRKPEEES